MRVGIYLLVGLASLTLGCKPKSKFHDGEYVRAAIKQTCYDSEGAMKATESAHDDGDELLKLEIAHGIVELHYNNPVRIVEEPGDYGHTKVRIDTGQECWIYGSQEFLRPESPNDLPPTPLSPTPNYWGRR